MTRHKLRSPLLRRALAHPLGRRAIAVSGTLAGPIAVGRVPSATKVHGLLRTGTNYISALVEQNFFSLALGSTQSGWKHGPMQWEPWIRFIVVVKNPYSWLVSFKNWEQINERVEGETTMDRFLHAPVSHSEFAQVWQAENPVNAWSRAVISWCELSERPNVLMVRYEDLLTNFQSTMRSLSELYPGRHPEPFVNIETRVDTWKTPKPRADLDTSYYQGGGFMSEFSAENLAFIRQRIDGNLVSRLGYELG